MTFDTHSLFGYSGIIRIVSVSATEAVITVNTGDGDRFATNQQVVIFPNGAIPKYTNSMVGRITDVDGDDLTINIEAENREGSQSITIQVGFKIANSITPKIFTDIEELLTTLSSNLSSHISSTSNPHSVTKTQVGLGNVENTADLDKPISTATQSALDDKSDIGHTHTKTDIGLGNVTNDAQLKASDLDTDTSFSANSDTKIPSQKAVKAYADGLVTGLLNDRGNYDASANTFPATGGSGASGAIKKGDLWLVTVAGILGGVAVNPGDQLRALSNAPGQTASNWAIMESNLGFVPENTANKSTDVTMTDNSTTKYPTQSAAKGYTDASVLVETTRAKSAEIVVNNGKVLKQGSYGYFSSLGTLVEGFETIGDWTQSGAGGSIASDTSHFKAGTQGLKLTSVNNVTCTATKTINMDLSDATIFGLWVYVDDITQIYSSPSIIYISSTTDFSKYFNYNPTHAFWKNGWNFVQFTKSDFLTFNGESWSNTMLRIRVATKSIVGGTVNFTFDNLVKNFVARPKCVITFDDGAKNNYTVAYPYLQSNGLKATFYVPMSPTRIGTANYCSLAELQEMYAAGHDIGSHSYTHVNLTTITLGQAENEVVNEFNALINAGFIRSAYHMAWPFSNLNDDLVAMVNRLGMKSSRTGNNGVQSNIVTDFQQLNRREITTSFTLADYYGWIDDTIAHNATIIFNLHNIRALTGDDTDLTPADYYALIDYIKAKKDAGLIDVVTISEWYEGLRGLTTGDLVETPNKNFVTDAQKLVIAATSGVNTGDETAITKGAFINGLTAKATPVDTDMVSIMDTESTPTVNTLKKLSWLNIKATLKTYFDSLYLAVGGAAASCSGNAATATKLAATKTINAVPFDGSANIKTNYITPADHGVLLWSMDPVVAVNSYLLVNKGTAHVVRIPVPYAMTISNIYVYIAASGGATLSNSFMAIYQNASLLAQSADQSTSWQSSGLKTVAIGPISVAAGYIDVVFWVGDWGTAPTFARAAGSSFINLGLSTTTLRFATADTGLTTTAPPTLGTKGALSVAFWLALA